MFCLLEGEILGTLCRCHGTSVYDSIKDRVLEGVLTNLQRQPLEESSKEEQKHAEQLTEKIAGADKSQKVMQQLCYFEIKMGAPPWFVEPQITDTCV